MEDSRIVELYWERNEEAISETKVKYENYLSKIAYNILADIEDSRESVNDTYLRAWYSMPPHKPQKLSAFLARITRNISIDIYRKKGFSETYRFRICRFSR
ncbi:MAG: sigma factor [Acutalibacteraceae bacterium]|nr:sigma factor [Acutalibacteraceae bacterium]